MNLNPEILKFLAATSVCADKDTCERVLSGTKRPDGTSVLDTMNQAFSYKECSMPIIPFETQSKWCIAFAVIKEGERHYMMLGFEKTVMSKDEFHTLLPTLVSDLSRDLKADVKFCKEGKPPAPWMNPHQRMMN